MNPPYTKQFNAKPPEALARTLTRIVQEIVDRYPDVPAPKNNAVVILLEHAAKEYDAGNIHLPALPPSLKTENAALRARVAELESELARKA